MRTRSKSLMVMIVLLIWAFSFPGHSRAHGLCLQKPPEELTPENTVILANQTDARFSQDYSVLLKSLRLEWAVVDSATVPDAVKDKNLILLGRLDAAYTGEIMRSMLTAEEIETIRAAGDRHRRSGQSQPLGGGQNACTFARALTCSRRGTRPRRRSGRIMAGSPPASAWIRTSFDAPLDERCARNGGAAALLPGTMPNCPWQI